MGASPHRTWRRRPRYPEPPGVVSKAKFNCIAALATSA